MPMFCKNIFDWSCQHSLAIPISDNRIPASIYAVNGVCRNTTTAFQEIISLLNNLVLTNFLSPFPNGFTNNSCVNIAIHFIAIIR